jgi:hypothetical protein
MNKESTLRRNVFGAHVGFPGMPAIAMELKSSPFDAHRRNDGEGACSSVRYLRGVKSVINRILVNSRAASIAEVRKQIRIALRRSKKKDIAAWFAPGVSAVANYLIVSE